MRLRGRGLVEYAPAARLFVSQTPALGGSLLYIHSATYTPRSIHLPSRKRDPYILLTGATGFNTTFRLLLFLHAYSVLPPKGLGEHVIIVVVNNLNIALR
jgi:hypothetical protein